MRGIDYVVLFDQDSYLSSQLILKLYETQKKVSGLKSVVAPLPLNRITNEPYRLTILGRYKGLLEVREMLNSGMFIPLCLFSEVGMMDEYLFIDGVDSEWCWRAMNKGIHLFVNPQIKMEHMLGEGDKYLLGKRISIPAPVRTYYQFRNYCILLMRSYVPFNWKLINGIKYTVKFIYYSLCVSPRISYLQKMILGIRDGIRYCLRSLFCA